MATVSERVDRLEQVLANFIERTEGYISASHADLAEVRASNARTDQQLRKMQEQADKDRQQVERDRQQAI